jgi:hypothetical protein
LSQRYPMLNAANLCRRRQSQNHPAGSSLLQTGQGMPACRNQGKRPWVRSRVTGLLCVALAGATHCTAGVESQLAIRKWSAYSSSAMARRSMQVCGALTAAPMEFIIFWAASLTPWSGSHDGEGRSRICRSSFDFIGRACLRSEASGGVLARSLGQNLAALRIARFLDIAPGPSVPRRAVDPLG